jgi:hypothetical protein
MKIHLTEAHSEIITTTTSLLPGHFAAHRADGADDAARRADCVRVDPTRARGSIAARKSGKSLDGTKQVIGVRSSRH